MSCPIAGSANQHNFTRWSCPTVQATTPRVALPPFKEPHPSQRSQNSNDPPTHISPRPKKETPSGCPRKVKPTPGQQTKETPHSGALQNFCPVFEAPPRPAIFSSSAARAAISGLRFEGSSARPTRNHPEIHPKKNGGVPNPCGVGCPCGFLGVASNSSLSRDPNLTRKPPEIQGNGSGFGKERWLKRMGNQPLERSESILKEAHQEFRSRKRLANLSRFANFCVLWGPLTVLSPGCRVGSVGKPSPGLRPFCIICLPMLHLLWGQCFSLLLLR